MCDRRVILWLTPPLPCVIEGDTLAYLQSPMCVQKWYFSLPLHPRFVCIILEQPPNQWGSFALLRYNFPTGMKSMDYTSSSCRGGALPIEHFDFWNILILGAFWFLEHFDFWSILIVGELIFLDNFDFLIILFFG